MLYIQVYVLFHPPFVVENPKIRVQMMLSVLLDKNVVFHINVVLQLQLVQMQFSLLVSTVVKAATKEKAANHKFLKGYDLARPTFSNIPTQYFNPPKVFSNQYGSTIINLQEHHVYFLRAYIINTRPTVFLQIDNSSPYEFILQNLINIVLMRLSRLNFTHFEHFTLGFFILGHFCAYK